MTEVLWSARLPLAIGFASVAFLVGGVGVWSVGTEIAGAVVATGVVEVQNERQVVQHPDGGVVGEILARDGDRVDAGDILVRLDGTFLRSELEVVERQLAEISARRSRLVAERDGTDQPKYERLSDFELVSPEEVQEQIDGQTNLFLARRTSLENELDQLARQQDQIARQIEGVVAQQDALERQRALILKELEGLQKLLDDGLVQANRVLALQREDARMSGELGRLIATIGEAETKTLSIAIERTRLASARREGAISELRDLGYSEIELVQNRNRLREQLVRLDVRAPVSGIVFGSRVAAFRSVVRPADPMLFIVPGEQPLKVAARIEPTDVDQVFPGQEVALVFSAFNRRTTPEVNGQIMQISADAKTDEVTGATFYEATIKPTEEALSALEDLTLIPGMPVEAFIKTEDRTPINYLVQPLTEYFARAFREE